MQCGRKDGFGLTWFPFVVVVVSSEGLLGTGRFVALSETVFPECRHLPPTLWYLKRLGCFGSKTLCKTISGVFDLCKAMIWSLKLDAYASSCSKSSSQTGNFCKVIKRYHMH